MKQIAQSTLLILLPAFLALTVGLPQDPGVDPVEAAGRVTEPYPVTLRVCAKNVLARAIVDGRLSLPEAAALWREVLRRLPDEKGLTFAAECDLLEQPPATEEERLCRHMILWVKTLGKATVVARVEAEYLEWRQGDGRLPIADELVPSPDELLDLARDEWLTETRGSGHS
jgi:hypothetical protein